MVNIEKLKTEIVDNFRPLSGYIEKLKTEIVDNFRPLSG